MRDDSIKKIDNSLLSLEKKLETYSTDDIIINKFKLKPEINKNDLTKGKDVLNKYERFLDVFKQSTNDLLTDEVKLKEVNIENEIFENAGGQKYKNFVKMNLGLGILESKAGPMLDSNHNLLE